MEWAKEAHDPAAWDKIVYGEVDDDDDNVIGRRRQLKWFPAAEPWVDPRLNQPAYGGLIWGARRSGVADGATAAN